MSILDHSRSATSQAHQGGRRQQGVASLRFVRWWAGGLLGLGLISPHVSVAPRLVAAETEAAAGTEAAGAEEKAEAQPLKIAEGQLQLSVPGKWEMGRPRVRIIEHEVKVPRSEGDDADGRLTMMAATGSAQANLDRWVGQFKDPQGPQVEKVQVAGVEVQIVDLQGTYLDQAGGPLGPKVERPKYRMLGAMIPLPNQAHYFLKLYGPEKTITDNREAFRTMVQSLTKP